MLPQAAGLAYFARRGDFLSVWKTPRICHCDMRHLHEFFFPKELLFLITTILYLLSF